MAIGLSRRLRGIIGVAGTWAAAFAGFGFIATVLAMGIAVGVGGMPSSLVRGIGAAEWIAGVLRWAALGAVSGAGFAIAVIRNGRGRTVDDLIPGRVALWGAGAGAVGSAVVAAAGLVAINLSGKLGDGVPTSIVAAGVCGLAVMGGVLGATLATATLRAARRAPTTADHVDAAEHATV